MLGLKMSSIIFKSIKISSSPWKLPGKMPIIQYFSGKKWHVQRHVLLGLTNYYTVVCKPTSLPLLRANNPKPLPILCPPNVFLLHEFSPYQAAKSP